MVTGLLYNFAVCRDAARRAGLSATGELLVETQWIKQGRCFRCFRHVLFRRQMLRVLRRSVRETRFPAGQHTCEPRTEIYRGVVAAQQCRPESRRLSE